MINPNMNLAVNYRFYYLIMLFLIVYFKEYSYDMTIIYLIYQLLF